MKTSETTTKVYSALFKAKLSFERAKKSENNPFFKSKYADLNSILDACEEGLSTEKLMVLQPVVHDETGTVVETRIVHVDSGEWVSSTMPLILVKNDMQAAGSAVTYARRYSLQAILGLQTEDDDGEAASGRPKGAPWKQQDKNNEAKAKETVAAVEKQQPSTFRAPGKFKAPEKPKAEAAPVAEETDSSESWT